MKIKYLLFFTLIPFLLSAQSKKTLFIHSFSNSISFGLEGGLSLTSSDFRTNNYEIIGRGLVEYFYYSNNIGTFGMRLHGGLTYLGGKNGLSNTNEYPELDKFETAVFNIGGGYSYILDLGNSFYPYIYLGLSYIKFYPKSNNISISSITKRKFANDDINYDGELGFRFLLNENFSLNLSGTLHYNPSDNLDGIWVNDNDDLYITGNIGLSYYFKGAKDSDGDGVDDSEDYCPNTSPHYNVNEFGCPLDEDNDGIPDQDDLCLGTEPNTIVDKNGCPADLDQDGIIDTLDKCLYTPEGFEVDNFGCPVDVDFDGVPDSIDVCLYTPLGVEVDEKGCPVDNDNDGIVDYIDRCPDTPPGYTVDSLGCPDIIYDTTFNHVVLSNYAFGSVEIPSKFLSIVRRIAEYALAHPEFSWRIEGHSDNISESSEENYLVSIKRAEKVFEFLVNAGVSKKKIKKIGLSQFNPIADNQSATGRSKNRRVEIIKIRF